MFIATYNYHKNIEINLHSEIVVKVVNKSLIVWTVSILCNQSTMCVYTKGRWGGAQKGVNPLQIYEPCETKPFLDRTGAIYEIMCILMGYLACLMKIFWSTSTMFSKSNSNIQFCLKIVTFSYFVILNGTLSFATQCFLVEQ